MRRKFIGALLFGALLVAPTSTFVSCSDYDDEIANLQAQIDANKTEVGTLVSDKITAVEAVIANLEAADASIEAQLADLEEADAATMAAAQSLVQAAQQELMGTLQTVVAMIQGNTASIEALVAADAKLQTAIEAAQAKADAAYTLAEAADAKAQKALDDLATVKKSLEDQITALDAKLVAELDKLAKVDAAVAAQIAALEAAGETVNGELAKLAKAIADQKTALEKVINDAVAGVQASLNTEVAGLKVSIADVTTAYQVAVDGVKAELDAVKVALQEEITTKVNALASEMKILGMLLQAELKSLVFEPQYYYHGIEAMKATSFKFNYWTTEDVDPDGDYKKDVPTEKDVRKVMPILAATYHLNPSNAAIDTEDINKFNFVVLDRGYVKAADEILFAPEIETANVSKDGKLTVYANVRNAEEILDIEKDGKVTVVALQYTKGFAEAGDTVITSDYAAVRAEEATDLALSFAGKESHLYTTAIEAIEDKDNKAVEIVWNDEDGLDLDELVCTHYVNNLGVHSSIDGMAADGKAKNLGFEYSYELVGWHDGEHSTSETAHLGYNPENNRVRAQMPKDGKWQESFDAIQDRPTINREPLVRVTLTYTKGEEVIAAVGYIKFKIVAEKPADPEFVTIPFEMAPNAYTVACGTEVVYQEELSWWQVEEKILHKLSISKDDFHKDYEVDGVNYVFNNYASDGLTPTTHPISVGTVKQTNVDKEGHMTEVIQWSITNNEAYEIFTQKDKNGALVNKDVTVYVRYKLKANANQKYDYVYVALNWTPSAINVAPAASIMDSDKNDNYWYAKNSMTPGYDDIHIHAEVPGQTNANCEIKTDLTNTFDANKFGVLHSSEVYNQFFDAIDDSRQVVFVQDDELYTNVPGASSIFDPNNTDSYYNLEVSADGKQLLVKGTTEKVAEITTDNEIKLNEQSAAAKDMLNFAGHNELGDKKTFTVKLGFAYTFCSPVNAEIVTITNNTFYVKILRPVDTEEGSAEFVDAATNNSTALVKFDFEDWRDHKFVDNDIVSDVYKNYYAYYGFDSNSNGVTCIEPMMDDIYTDMDGRDINTTKLNDVSDKVDFEYVWKQGNDNYISKHYFGELVYQNNGNTVKPFNIRIPVKVHYTWGTIYTYINASVGQTINNANKK